MSTGDASQDRVNLLYLFDVLRREQLVLVPDISLWNMPTIILTRQGSLGQRAVCENCDAVLPAVGENFLLDFPL
jgi:hypothetical protein